MSSLSNVTKTSQYTDSGARKVRLSRLASSQRHNELTGVPAARRDAEQGQGAVLQEALGQAKNIVGNARSYTTNQLRESMAQMNEETSHIRTVGYQEDSSKGSAGGFEKGYSEGYEKGYGQSLQEDYETEIQELQEQSNRRCAEITQLIEDLEQSKLRTLKELRLGIETLSIQTAREALHQEINDGIAVPTIVSGVLEEYHDQEWARIHVSSRATELSQVDLQLMERLQPVSKNLRTVPSVLPRDSGCQIDLPDRQPDAEVETQLKEISYELHL